MLSCAKYRMESGFAGAIMTLRLAPHARAEINLYWAARPPILAKATATVGRLGARSEENTSELQSLMRISYAVFCLKKKKSKTIEYIRTEQLTRYNIIKTQTT